MASSTDWEAIEREYRAGQLSVSEIGRQHGVSHTAINKRAKRQGWARDLSQRIRQEVSARLVSAEVSAANAREAVEQAAARGVEVVRQHRSALGRAHRVVEKLLAEVERGSDDAEAIEAAVEAETAGDANGNRRSTMMKAVSLPTRVATLRELSQAMKNLIPLERQAFNLSSDTDDDPATKADVRTALGQLNQGQRDQLRAIAETLAGGPGGAPARA